MARVPSYAKTTALVSRALALAPDELVAGFVPATQLDLASIVELRKQVVGAQRVWDDSRYLTWRYHLGSTRQSGGECWVVKRGGEVLAMVGSERVSVLHRGRAVSGLSVMDIAVRPDLDGIGLGAWMAMHLCEHVDCVLAIGSNHNSRAIVSKVFTRLPDRRSYAHLIEFGPTLQRKWRSSAWRVTLPAALAGRGMWVWRWAASLARDRTLRIEPLLRFEPSISRLIAESHAQGAVHIDRSAEFLNWRLFENPRSSYSVWAAYELEHLVGYMAIRVKAVGDGKDSFVIEDYLVGAGKSGIRVLRSLLAEVLAVAVARGCERVSVIACHPEAEDALRACGFMPRPEYVETLSVRSKDERLSEAIAVGVPWHVTGVNTDRDD